MKRGRITAARVKKKEESIKTYSEKKEPSS
jgi:hypothetical protein